MSAGGGGPVVKYWHRAGGWRSLGLAAWSVLLLVLWLGGRLDLYLHPDFRPLVAMAGLVLAMMVVGLCVLPREADPPVRDLGRVKPWWDGLGLFALVLPACAAALIGPQGYSLGTVLNRGIIKAIPGTGDLARELMSVEELPLPRHGEYSPAMAGAEVQGQAEEGAVEEGVADFFQYIEKSPQGAWRLEMLDLVYAAQTRKLRQKMETENIELIGQVVTKTPGAVPGEFSLVRLLMVCCAADARPLGVWVHSKKGAAGFQEMDWVRITGRPTFPVREGRRVVVIEAGHMAATEPPDEVFVFQ